MDIILKHECIEDIMLQAVSGQIKSYAEGYSSPFRPIIEDALKAHAEGIRDAVYKAVSDAVKSEEFEKNLKAEMHKKLARLAIAKCTGLAEKEFSKVMQDTVLKNKIQARVIELIEGHSEG